MTTNRTSTRQGLALLSVLACAAGNAAAQGLVATQAVIVATDGDPVPSSDGTPIPNFTFGGSGALGNNCALDANGNVFFMGRVVDSGGSTTTFNDQALFRGTSRSDLRMIVRGADQAPTMSPGVLLRTATGFSSAISSAVRVTPDGRLYWGSTVFDSVGTAIPPVTSVNDGAIFGGFPGSQGVLVRRGDPAPGTVGATYAQAFASPSQTTTGMNREGRIYFQGSLSGGDTVSTSGMNNQAGIWSGLPGSLELVARRSRPAVGLGGAVAIDTGTALGSIMQMNDAGSLLYEMTLSTTQGSPAATVANDRALMVHTPGGTSVKIVREGDVAPNTSGGTFNAITADAWVPGVNSNAWTRNAQTIFVTELRGGDVTTTTNRAIYTGGAGGLTRVVRTGDAAPGTGAGVVFSAFATTNALLNANGQVAFQATVSGTGVTTANDTGVWTGTPGSLSLVLREGTVMPGTGNSLAGGLSGTAIYFNDLGQVLFNVSLSGGTITGTSLWAWDPVNGLVAVVLNGDQVQYGPGLFRTVSSFGLLMPSNADGGSLGFGHDGKLGLRLGFTGSVGAIVTVVVPHPCITPVITVNPVGASRCAGSPVTFLIAAQHTSAITYQWYQDGMPLVDGGNISGAMSATLTIAPALGASAGAYSCVATTACGTSTSSAATMSVDALDTDGDLTADCADGCPLDPLKIAPGVCGCGLTDQDTDADGTADCIDGCPNDPLKIAPGICGCGVSDVDSDLDGTPDCNDGCPNDPFKLAPGICGCGVSDVDSDLDGTPDCHDGCPNDPAKLAPGQCGCGFADTDTDGDGTADCNDGCPGDPTKIAPGICGCGVADTDSDGDGTADCFDGCPNDPAKISPGICGCGVADTDSDGDGTADCFDGCPNDPSKTAPGICGCGVADADSDGDGTADCFDGCPNDPSKTAPGICGCGVADADSDGDGTADCFDGCPNDPAKTAPGICGCGVADTDSDGDGTADCFDGCPDDPAKTAPGICGCGVSDTDSDGDGTADCFDGCVNDPLKIAPGQCGCGFVDVDSDADGVADCVDNCDTAVNAGQGDADNDGVGDACDNCGLVMNPGQGDCDADGIGDACEIAFGGALDCNHNEIPDSCDIASLTSQDANTNQIPDECELDGGTPYCFGYAGCPCGNNSSNGSGQGCRNSTGQGAALSGSGLTSVSNDQLVLSVIGMPLPQPPPGVMVFFQGDAKTNLPFKDGLRCASGNVIRVGKVQHQNGMAVTPLSGGLSISQLGFVPPGGGVRYYQGWYRNNLGPCGTGSNLTNGLSVIWAP